MVYLLQFLMALYTRTGKVSRTKIRSGSLSERKEIYSFLQKRLQLKLIHRKMRKQYMLSVPGWDSTYIREYFMHFVIMRKNGQALYLDIWYVHSGLG